MKTRKFIIYEELEDGEYEEVESFDHLAGITYCGSFSFSPQHTLVEIVEGFGTNFFATADVSEILGSEKQIFALVSAYAGEDGLKVNITGSRHVRELTVKELEIVGNLIAPAIDIVMGIVDEEKGLIPEDIFFAPACEEPEKN